MSCPSAARPTSLSDVPLDVLGHTVLSQLDAAGLSACEQVCTSLRDLAAVAVQERARTLFGMEGALPVKRNAESFSMSLRRLEAPCYTLRAADTDGPDKVHGSARDLIKSHPSKFNCPAGSCWLHPNTLVVADHNNDRIKVLNPVTAEVLRVHAVRRPTSVAALTETNGRTILYVASSGTPGAVFPIDAVTGEVCEQQLACSAPAAVAISPDGQRLAVTSCAPLNEGVWLFDLSASGDRQHGSRLDLIADADGNNGSLKFPSGVAFSPDGSSVIVCDQGKNCIRVFPCDQSRETADVFAVSSPISTPFRFTTTPGPVGTLCKPKSLCVDSSGCLLVQDSVRLQVFDNDGSFVCVLADLPPQSSNRMYTFGGISLCPQSFRIAVSLPAPRHTVHVL